MGKKKNNAKPSKKTAAIKKKAKWDAAMATCPPYETYDLMCFERHRDTAELVKTMGWRKLQATARADGRRLSARSAQHIVRTIRKGRTRCKQLKKTSLLRRRNERAAQRAAEATMRPEPRAVYPPRRETWAERQTRIQAWLDA